MNKFTRLTALLLAMLMIFSTVASAESAYQVGGMTVDNWQSIVDSAEEKLFPVDEGDSGKTVTPPPAVTPAPGAYYPYADSVSVALSADSVVAPLQITASGVAVLQNADAGQWQMQIGGEWVGITGTTGSELWVTSAMMNGMTSADFRKGLGDRNAETGEYSAYTAVATVEIVAEVASTAFLMMSRAAEDEAAATPTPAPVTAANDVMTIEDANPDLSKYHIFIHYVFGASSQKVGNQAAEPYHAEVSTNKQNFSATVKHPNVIGYEPDYDNAYVKKEDASATEDLPNWAVPSQDSITITNAALSGDISIYVPYKPAANTFDVYYWEELPEYTTDSNGDTVKYALVDKREDEQGITEAPVKNSYPAGASAQYYATLRNDAANSGFKALMYDEDIDIAADGSTVVNVYYQRLYYLMTFDLGGGYGVNPIYTKHGAKIEIDGEAHRPGYEFMGWTEDPNATVYTQGQTFATIPELMPIGGKQYYAVWKPVETNYMVVYRLENPNWTTGDPADEQYLFWGAVEETAVTGTTVYATGRELNATLATQLKLDTYEYRYSSYNETKTNAGDGDGVEVAGDGSTVLNVYYDRNEYTLKFYYAMSASNNYYVIGGSTYYFGALEELSQNENNALYLMQQYFTGRSGITGNRGQVSELPTLNDEGKARNYTSGSDSLNDRTYYYIAFKAKYGADITYLWPSNVFNEVTAQNWSANSWNGTAAFVSAWNGERNVYYTQLHSGAAGSVDDNQTIKGNYTKLDYQLLWDYDKFGDSSEVDFLCFWENGANVSWSIPELYNYRIYVPLLEGETTDKPTRTYGGITYYEKYLFVTIDDSDHSKQTPPAISGLTYKAYEHTPITLTEEQKNLYAEGYDMFFYYTRDEYTLTFSNYDLGTSEKKHVFEEDISSYATMEPAHPDAYPEGAYYFDGWYTSPALQPEDKYTFTTMPANNVLLYAKWSPYLYDVRVYATQNAADDARAEIAATGTTTVQSLYQWVDLDEHVKHGSSVSSAYTYDNPNQYDPATNDFPKPTRPGYDFSLWCYYAPDGTVQPFSFNATPITQDTFVFAVWTADTISDYTIYYVKQPTGAMTEEYYKDEANWVAYPLTDSGLAGAYITEYAKQPNVDGYFPVTESHSFFLEVEAAENVYVFEYREVGNMPYVVHYVTATKPETGNYEEIPLVVDGVEGTYYKLIDSKPVEENTKAVVTENYVSVGGSYVPDAFQKRLYIDADMTAEERVIVFIYTKDEEKTTLTVNHYLVKADAPDTPILYDYENKIVDLTPNYTETLEAMVIPNYTYNRIEYTGDHAALSGMTITIEKGSAGVTVNLYYTENTVTINYKAVGPAGATDFGSVSPETEATTIGVMTGTPAGSTATAGEYYTFVGWFSDEDCTSWVDANNKIIPQKVNGLNVSATYYAKFEEQEADIQYIAIGPDGVTDFGTVALNGSTESGKTQTGETVPVKTGEAIGATADPNDPTFKFVGWYTKDDQGEYVKIENASANYIPQKDGEAWPEHSVYYALFEYNLTSLTITKEAATGTTIDNNETFIFTVSGGDLQKNITVVIQGAGSVTIDGLTVGQTYTVIEDQNWSWRYTATDADRSIKLVPNGNVVTFTNKKTNNQWLSDEGAVVNTFDNQ